MQILEKVKQKIAFSEKFSILSAAKLRHLGKPPADFIIALRAMGEQAAGAVLDAAFRISKSAAAARQELSVRSYDLVLINGPLPDETGARLAADLCCSS